MFKAVNSEPVENPWQTMANRCIPVKTRVLRKTRLLPTRRKLAETNRKSMGSEGLPSFAVNLCGWHAHQHVQNKIHVSLVLCQQHAKLSENQHPGFSGKT